MNICPIPLEYVPGESHCNGLGHGWWDVLVCRYHRKTWLLVLFCSVLHQNRIFVVVYWLLRRWIHRVSARAAGVVSFYEKRWVPVRSCAVSIFLVIGRDDRGCIRFPIPRLYRYVAERCRGKVNVRVQVCWATCWYARRAWIRNSKILIVIIAKRTN